jgi:hypothetical protein
LKTPLRHWFVYYKVRNPSEAIGQVQRAQRALVAKHPGLTCQCFVRTDGATDGDALATLMEAYQPPAGDIHAALLDEIHADLGRALAPWLVGQRHLETFDRCA